LGLICFEEIIGRKIEQRNKIESELRETLQAAGMSFFKTLKNKKG
jgi:hypothetical protein